MTLSVNDFTAGDVITASAMNTNFATIEGYVNSSPGLAALSGATFSGTVTFNAGITSTGGTTALGTTTTTTLTTTGAVTVGSNTSGHDVTFYGASDGKFLLWDSSDNMLEITGVAGTNALAIHDGNLYLEDNATINGTVDINGATDIAGDLTLSGGGDGALRFTVAGENSIRIPDDQASALIIKQGPGTSNAYMTFSTTNSSESITIYKPQRNDYGSSSAPSISFNGDTDTGIYRAAANKVGIAGNIEMNTELEQFTTGGYATPRRVDEGETDAKQLKELVSSERFKKDIVDLPKEEAYKILDARPIKYRGVDDDSSVPLEAGLSAESLHEAGYTYAVRYDEGHWGTTPRNIYYDMLVAPLITIVKDLSTRLAALES